MATTIEDLKTQLVTLKTRSEALVAKKDGLIRQVAQADEQEQVALRELAELGYPQVGEMTPEALVELQNSVMEELVAGMAVLSETVVAAEAMLNVAKPTASLDL